MIEADKVRLFDGYVDLHARVQYAHTVVFLSQCTPVTNSYVAPLFIKMAQNLDLRCVLVQ